MTHLYQTNGVTVTNPIMENFILPQWPAPARVKAFTTLRHSNIGIRQAEISPEPKAGDIDRQRLKQLLPLPNEPIWLKQIHSNIIVEATAKNQESVADASFSTKPRDVCTVLTADCLPVLMCHRDGTHVAAIHAGWRGLANGILETTLKTLNLPPEDILVWFGPAISAKHFEVRKDVYDIFTQHDPNAASAFTLFAPEHWHADIYALARLRLQSVGVKQIYGGEYCTYSDQNRFYSYRRDGVTTGRIVSLIWIEDSDKNL